MNIVFIFGMPFDVESKNVLHKKLFKNSKIKYYLTNYINRWSCNNIEQLSNNKNYVLNQKLSVDHKIYDKNMLLDLYEKYYSDFFKLLKDIFYEEDESGHYFSQIQETINDYVYFKEIANHENLKDFDKIIFMSLNMNFKENELDFISCFNDSFDNFLRDHNEFYTNKVLRKSDLLFFDYEFVNLAWNFWWTDISNFYNIVNNLNEDLLYIYEKMKIDNKVPIIDTEIARGYILNKYISHKGPMFIEKHKPNFEFLENDISEKFKKVERI